MAIVENFDIKKFLEHHGVQGMKWGRRREYNRENRARLQSQGLTKRQARNTNRYQNLVDRQRMVASGQKGKVKTLQMLQNRSTSNSMLSLKTIAKHPLSSQKAAKTQLESNQKVQKKILNGEAKVRGTLLKLQGISIKDIDYSQN